MGSPLKRIVRKANRTKSRTDYDNTLAYSTSNDLRSNIHTLEFQLEDRHLKLERMQEDSKDSNVSKSYFLASQNQVTQLKNSSQTMTFGKGSETVGFVREKSVSRKGSRKNGVVDEEDEVESQEFNENENLMKKNRPNVVQSELIKKTSSGFQNGSSEKPINFESFEPYNENNGGVIDKITEDESRDVSDISKAKRKGRRSTAQSSDIDPIFREIDDGEIDDALMAKFEEGDHKCLDDFQMMKNIWKQHKIIKDKKSYDAVVL